MSSISIGGVETSPVAQVNCAACCANLAIEVSGGATFAQDCSSGCSDGVSEDCLINNDCQNGLDLRNFGAVFLSDTEIAVCDSLGLISTQSVTLENQVDNLNCEICCDEAAESEEFGSILSESSCEASCGTADASSCLLELDLSARVGCFVGLQFFSSASASVAGSTVNCKSSNTGFVLGNNAETFGLFGGILLVLVFLGLLVGLKARKSRERHKFEDIGELVRIDEDGVAEDEVGLERTTTLKLEDPTESKRGLFKMATDRPKRKGSNESDEVDTPKLADIRDTGLGEKVMGTGKKKGGFWDMLKSSKRKIILSVSQEPKEEKKKQQKLKTVNDIMNGSSMTIGSRGSDEGSFRRAHNDNAWATSMDDFQTPSDRNMMQEVRNSVYEGDDEDEYDKSYSLKKQEEENAKNMSNEL